MADMALSGSGGGSGKGVGVRLFVQGGDLVRKTFDQVADSGKKMWAELGAGTKTANPALQGINAVADEVKGGIQGLADEAGGFGRALGAIGPLGLAAAAAMGGLAIAVNRAREAMTWAADLTDQAAALGVSTEALQAYRFAGEELGSSAEAIEASLGGLNKTIGALKTGLGDGKAQAALAAIGFTPEQIAGFTTADQLLVAVADKMQAAGDIAEATKIADALGIDRELIPALMRGGDAINQATEKARELGLVMEEDVVRGLDAANREAEIAQQRIGMELRRAFVELAPAIAGSASALADFLGWVRVTVNDPGFQNLMTYLMPGGADIRRGMRRIRNQAESAARSGTTDDSSVASNYDLSGLYVNSPPAAPRPLATRTGGGASRGGGGSSAPAPGIKAQRYDRIDIVSIEDIERMQLAMQLETARIQKNEALIAVLERELELRKLIDDFTRQGLTAEDARLSAEMEQSNRDTARWVNTPLVNRGAELTASAAEMAANREARIAQEREVFGEAVVQAFRNKEAFLASILQSAAEKGFQAAGEVLYDIIRAAFASGDGAYGSGGGDSGWGWKLVNSVADVLGFSPGTAPGSGGGGGGGGAGGAGASPVAVTVKLDGARTDREIRDLVSQGVQVGVSESTRIARESGHSWDVQRRLMTD